MATGEWVKCSERLPGWDYECCGEDEPDKITRDKLVKTGTSSAGCVAVGFYSERTSAWHADDVDGYRIRRVSHWYDGDILADTGWEAPDA